MIVFFFRLLILAVAIPCVLGGLAACDAPLTFLAGESDNNGLLTTSWSGDKAVASVASYRTARTQADWEALWRMAGQEVPAALPSGKMAVAIFLGQRFEPGTRVEFISTSSERQRTSDAPVAVIVWQEVRRAAPRQTAGSPAVATDVSSPWAIRLIDASVLPPQFRQDNS